jgi:hypothetical protein
MYLRERESKHKYTIDGRKTGRFFSLLGEEGAATEELSIVVAARRRVRDGVWHWDLW